MIDEIFNEQVKEAKLSGYIDADMLGNNINTLNSITVRDGIVYLAGDKVSLIPKYKRVELQIGRFPITGSTKTEIVMTLLKNNEHLKIGEFMGWHKYLMQFKEHTLVISIHDRMYSSIKLLKDDRIAKEMYKSTFKTPINEWRTVEMVSKQYGPMAIGIPHVVDDIMERIDTAVEFLESVMNDHNVARYVEFKLRSLYEREEDL